MEGGIKILFANAVLWGLLVTTHATSCGEATNKMCAKTLMTTGACTPMGCACIDGYLSSPFGCVEQAYLKPQLFITFNGQVELDVSFVIQCLGGRHPFQWYQDGALVPTRYSTDTLAVLSAHTAEYMCQCEIDGVVIRSDVINIQVGAVTKKPRVSGMPTEAFANMMVTLHCSDAPLTTDVYQWFVGGVKVFESSESSFNLTLSKDHEKVPVSCKMLLSSDVVFTPKYSDDIPSIEIKSPAPEKRLPRTDLHLTCQIPGGFLSEDHADVVSYTWMKDGKALPSGTSGTIYKPEAGLEDSGVYMCKAKLGKEEEKTSAPFHVIYGDFLQVKNITTSATKFLTTGYFSLTCDFTIVDPSIPVSFEWYRNGQQLSGLFDRTLQINQPGSSADGSYACVVKTGMGSVRSNHLTVLAQEPSVLQSTSPTVTEIAGVSTFVVGTTHTFVCSSEYYTPGSKFKWYLDSIEQAEDSNTFPYKATLQTRVIGCTYSFGEHTTPLATMDVVGCCEGSSTREPIEKDEDIRKRLESDGNSESRLIYLVVGVTLAISCCFIAVVILWKLCPVWRGKAKSQLPGSQYRHRRLREEMINPKVLQVHRPLTRC